MPVLNGLEVIEETKRLGYNNSIFIIITAHNYFEYAQKSLRLGAKDLLLKPVQYQQFCETMQRVIGYKYSNNPLFNQILEYIHEHYMQNIDLADCAAVLSTSPNNVARLLKKYLDTNFTAYYNKLRITTAQDLFMQGTSIKEVSHAVGYQNLNYFYRKFKEQVGVTPKEFINNSIMEKISKNNGN